MYEDCLLYGIHIIWKGACVLVDMHNLAEWIFGIYPQVADAKKQGTHLPKAGLSFFAVTAQAGYIKTQGCKILLQPIFFASNLFNCKR